jgi:hypothetical protein
MEEQAKAAKEITAATANVAKQIKLVAQANIGHSAGVASVTEMTLEARRLCEKNGNEARTLAALARGAKVGLPMGEDSPPKVRRAPLAPAMTPAR